MAKITSQALVVFLLFSFSLQARSGYYKRFWESKRRQVAERHWVVKLKQNSFFNHRPFQFASPVADGNRLFVGVNRDLFYAVNIKRGRKLWTYRTQGPVHAAARTADGVVYFGDLEGIAYALDQEKGKPIWLTQLGNEILSAPLIVEDKIYFITVGRDIVCLNRQTGAIVWQVTHPVAEFGFSLKGTADPVQFGETMLLGFSDGLLAAYSLTDGSLRWTRQLGDPLSDQKDVDAAVLLHEGKGFVASADGKLTAFNPSNGEVLWEAGLEGGGGVNKVALADAKLYVAAGGVVSCLDAESGTLLWEQDLGVPETSAPAVYGDYLTVVATKGQAYFLDRNKGDVVYSWHVRGGGYGDPLQVEKGVYILSNSSRLYSFQFKK